MRVFALLASMAPLLLAGCPASLGDYRILGEGEDGGPRPMRDGGPPADTDGAAPGHDGGPDDLPPCGRPTLLIATETLENPPRTSGRVERFHLTATGATRCAPLTARGELHAQPFVVTGAGEMVVTAGASTVMAVDARTDRLLWTETSRGRAQDAFILDWEMESHPAVSWTQPGANHPREITVYEPSGNVAVSRSVPCCVRGITQSPSHPDRALATHDSSFAGREYEVEGWQLYSPDLIAAGGGHFYRSIYAIRTPGSAFRRIAWSGSVSGAERIFFLETRDESPAQAPGQVPSVCDCDPLHRVVPDPALPDGTPAAVIAICGYGGGGNRIVRFGDGCQILAEATGFGPGGPYRFSNLGVIP